MINEKKLIEELIPIFNEKDDMYLAGQIIALIDSQPKIDCLYCTRREWYQKGYQDGLNADKWIPCSERLPEKYGDYLVAIIPKAGVLWQRITIARYSDLMGICVQPSFHIGEVGKDSFEKLEGVVAWQPLPAPYKKEGAE